MADPLSIAASVAGLVGLVGTVSKTVFQFFTSIIDAPDSARHLVSSLSALNLALGQIQQNLVNPDFVSETGDEDIKALMECLTNCTVVFSELEKKVTDSGLGSAHQGRVSRTWKSVEWSFMDDDLDNMLKRVEAEKATLQLLTSAFTAKITSTLLRYGRQTEARTRKMDRRLQNISIAMEWIVQKVANKQMGDEVDGPETTESSVFAASSAYTGDELAKLLQSTGSSVSLALETTSDDTVSVVWQPLTERTLEPKAASSSFVRGLPMYDGIGRIKRTDTVLSSMTISTILRTQSKRKMWLSEAGSISLPPRKGPTALTTSTSLIGMLIKMSMFNYGSSFSALDLIGDAKRIVYQVQEDVQDMSSKLAFMDIYLDLFEDGQGSGDLYTVWKEMEESVRQYFDEVNRILQKSGKNSALAGLTIGARESDRTALKQAATQKMDRVHMLANALFMEQTCKAQRAQSTMIQDLLSRVARQSDNLETKLERLIEYNQVEDARRNVSFMKVPSKNSDDSSALLPTSSTHEIASSTAE